MGAGGGVCLEQIPVAHTSSHSPVFTSMELHDAVFFNWLKTWRSLDKGPSLDAEGLWGEWTGGRASADLDAELPHYDWRISWNPVLIDSYFETYTIT